MRQVTFMLSLLFASLATPQGAVDWSSLVEKVSPAVVTLVAADAIGIVQRSRFLISSDGKIVTNFHVIANYPRLLARRHDGSFLTISKVLATEKGNDLAVLQVKERNLPFLPLGDSKAVKVGEAICVIGSPLALEGSVSTGVVSAIRELRGGRKLFQITAPISEGSRGSSVFNRKGEVIGVVSFSLSKGQNLNFAIPIYTLKALLRKMDGEVEEALDFVSLLNEALQTARSIEDTSERLWALYYVAEGMSKVGQYQQAIQIAKSIEDAYLRSEALHLVAEVMAKAGQFQQAFQTAKSIEDADWRSEALHIIAEVVAEAGQFQQAFQIAKSIEDAGLRSAALYDVVKAMAEARQFQQALQITKSIGEARFRSGALCSVVKGMVKAGMKEEAQSILQQAIQVTKTIENADFRSEALCSVAEVILEAGMKEEAQSILRQAIQTAKSIENTFLRSGTLVRIALAILGDEEEEDDL